MAKIVSPFQRRVSGPFKIALNGTVFVYTEGSYVTDANHLALLDAAGINYEDEPGTTPTGNIILSRRRYGSRVAIAINGVITYLTTGTAISVTPEQQAILDRHGYVYSLEYGAAAPVVPLWTGTATVAATITGVLSNFPAVIDLSTLPNNFWSNVRSDRAHAGGNVRAYVGATRVAIDISYIDPVQKKGFMWVKHPALATGATVTLTCEALTSTQPSVGSQYSRTDVWSAYQHVYLFGRTGGVDRTERKPLAFVGDISTMYEDTSLPVLDTATYYQGIAWNASLNEYFNTGTNNIRRITDNGDGTFTTLQSKSQPWTGAGNAGIPNVTDGHNGGCEWYDAPGVPGGVYVHSIATGNGYGDYWMVVWRASDLAFLGKTQIGGGAAAAAMGGDFGAADCARNPVDGKWYFAQYTNALSVSRWTLDETTWTFTFDAKIDLVYSRTDTTITAASAKYQGIAFHRGGMFMNDTDKFRVYRFTPPTGGSTQAVGGDTVYTVPGTPAESENLTVRDDYLVALSRTTASVTRVKKLRPNQIEKGAGGGCWISNGTNGTTPRVEGNGLSALTEFTFSATIAVNNSISSTIRYPISYLNPGQTNVGAGFTRRANGQIQTNITGTVSAHATGINPITTPNNSGSAVPDAGSTKRYSTTVSQSAKKGRLVVDGVVCGDTAFTTDLANDLTRLEASVLYIDTAGGQSAGTGGCSCHVGFVYLYPGLLSDAWLQAEHAMVNNPATFWTIS